MAKVSIDSRDMKIMERARQLYRDQYDGNDVPVPEPYVRRAERQLIAEGLIQAKSIPVRKMASQ